MKAMKRIASALGVVLLSVAFAALVTYVTAPEDERPNLVEFAADVTSERRERQIPWDELPDEVIAWVEVPGTSIDEPIVQATPDSPNAYLYKDAMGQGAYGTPYIDCECTLDSPFVMIYGHHMSDGSAFADFARFIDEQYAREHDEILVYRREGEAMRLKPIAVDVVNASRETLVLGRQAEAIANSDLILQGARSECQVVAFATCSYQTWNSRTIVYAVSASFLPSY